MLGKMVSLSCAVGGQDLALAEHTVSTPPDRRWIRGIGLSAAGGSVPPLGAGLTATGTVHNPALPKLCKMAAAGGGACSPRGAHAAPGCPEAWSGCLPPALLPPLPPPLAPSSLPFTPGACCWILKVSRGFGCCFYVIFECACDSSVFFVLCLIASKVIWAIFMAFPCSKLI